MPLNNPSPAIEYTEAFSVVHNNAGVGAWEDWDISALIPPGCRTVDILCSIAAGGPTVGVRTNGSALNRYVKTGDSIIFTVKPDLSRIIDIYSNLALTNFQVVGYVT